MPSDPFTRNETQDNERDRQEMQEPKWMHVGLVDRMVDDPLRQPGRLDRREGPRVPAHCNEERHHDADRGGGDDDAGFGHAAQALCATRRAPSPEHEQELPGERIEIPEPVWIGGKIPAEQPYASIEARRSGEHDRGENEDPRDPPTHGHSLVVVPPRGKGSRATGGPPRPGSRPGW